MQGIISIPKRAFNEGYLEVIESKARYLVLYGGAGSGKSYFIVQRYIKKVLEGRMCNVLCIRNVGDTNRDSTFALFKQVIRKWKLGKYFKIRESDMRITCVTGNGILFKGLDDSEKLKSVTFEKGELTDVWVEEASEIEEADFKQLDIRLRGEGSKKQITISFNPIDVNHWLKKRFFDDKPGNAEILHTTYKDNKFLDADYVELLESYRETDPYFYDVYCLGRWGVLGDTIFDKNAIYKRLDEVREPLKRGSFFFETYYDGYEVLIKNPSIRFMEDPSGPIRIYRMPKKQVPYVLGGDTAGDGSDYFANQVIDNITGEQVAVLHQRYDEDIYADQTYCMGIYYNCALLGVEANYSTYPVKRLQNHRYPKQYAREKPDTYTGRTSLSYGWLTEKRTRPILIAEAVQIVRENAGLINDRETLEEMLNFVRNPKKKGRPEAAPGSHDDLVMAYGIALAIRRQQSKEAGFTEADVPYGYYTKEMEEDYNRASPEDRRLMLKMFGRPGRRYA